MTNKNPNALTATFGPDVKLEAKKYKDPGANAALRRVGAEMAPEGHSYKGSIAVHFYEPVLAKDLAVLTQFIGDKVGHDILSCVSPGWVQFGLSNLVLEFRKHEGSISKNSTTNKNDKR